MESLCWPPSDDVGSGHLVHRYYNRIRGQWSHSIVRCGVYRLTSYREISSCHFLYINRDTLSYVGSTTSPTSGFATHKSQCNSQKSKGTGLSNHFREGGCPNDEGREKWTLEFRGRGQSSSIYRQRIYYVGALALPPSPTNVTKEE